MGGSAAIRRRSPWLLLVSCVWLLTAPGVAGLWLNLPPTGTKCVSEEIQPNVVVLADYSVVYENSHDAAPTISAKVTSPYGNTLYHQEGVTIDRFAFTTTEAGNYLACFWLNNGERVHGASVNLDWKIGIAAKDWDSIAKKEKLQGVELELAKLESLVRAIHENLLYLKTRESEMRKVSERTNARVAWLSITSVAVCIAVSGLQLWHLQGFFQKKKLI